jgi:polygalacturonase
VFISNSTNVVVAGLRMQNSQFWTNHLYKCSRVKFIGCDVYSPHTPVTAPSTDGLDIDACTDVLVKNCRFEVSDDAIALKGGKGPWADTLPENGGNERILIEDCEFGPCCAIVTCGSECIHSKNVVIRNVKVDGAGFALWLKMRPDTPQLYEYITMENVTGFVGSVLFVKPWKQFFDLKDRKDIPLSYARNITIKDSEFSCHCFFNAERDASQYILSDIRMNNLKIRTLLEGIDEKNSEGVTFTDVAVTLVDAL